MPSRTSLAMVPPAPNSESSGWAVITSTRWIGSFCDASGMEKAPFVFAILPSRYNAAGDHADHRCRPARAAARGLPPSRRAPEPGGERPGRRALAALVVRRGARADDGGARRDPLARVAAARLPAARMTSVARILAVWLTPVVALAVPAALAARGPEGLWLGLVVTLAPLIALGAGGVRPAAAEGVSAAGTLFPVVTLLVTVGVLLWANIALAGVLRARTLDGARLADIEWMLAPGQTVTLRAGDEILRGSTLRLRFEADKRVPGSPASGMLWADARPRRWLERVGLAVTLLAGAAALLRAGLTVRLPRDGLGFAAGGLLLAAGLAAFLASSLALRERLGALDSTGGGEIGHDPGLWAGLFGGAALASLWPVDPWALSLLALGGAGGALGPAALWPPRHARTAATAGVIGLIVFVGLAAVQLRGAGGGPLGAAIAYPALVAAPVGACVLWLARRGRR